MKAKTEKMTQEQKAERVTKAKTKVIAQTMAQIAAHVGKQYVAMNQEEREIFAQSHWFGANAYNGYLPRIRFDEILLAVQIENLDAILSLCNRSEGRDVFYAVKASNGEIHGGRAEEYGITLEGVTFRILRHVPSGYIILGYGDDWAVRGLRVLGREDVVKMAAENGRGDFRAFEVQLPDDYTHCDGLRGKVTVAGALIGDMSTRRQVIVYPSAETGVGLLCLHTGASTTNERCNRAVQLGRLSDEDIKKLRVSLLGGAVGHRAREISKNTRKRAKLAAVTAK